MTKRLRELLESVFKLFRFFTLNTPYETETPHDNGLNHTLLAQDRENSDVEFEARESIFPPSTNTIRNHDSGNGKFAFENGKHCHFQRAPTCKNRLFEKFIKTKKLMLPRRARSSPSPEALEWERGIKSPSQNEVTACENMAMLSQKYGEIYDTIGRGTSGVILLSRKVQEWHPNINCLYAIKVFRRGTQTSEIDYRSRIGAEFSISSSLRHQNVIQIFDLLQVGTDSLCECMEYCSGGDLYSLIVAKGQLEKAEADCFFKQLMCGANYLHEIGIAHRDLKPENLFLTSNGCLKISDFGDAECFRLAWETDIHMSRIRRGSRPYVSPEQYLDQEFDPRSVDIWAAAMTYLVMRTGRIPWKIATDQDESFRDYVADRIVGRGHFFIEEICNIASRRVIYSMLDIQYVRRPVATAILDSRWLQETKTCTAAGSRPL